MKKIFREFVNSLNEPQKKILLSITTTQKVLLLPLSQTIHSTTQLELLKKTHVTLKTHFRKVISKMTYKPSSVENLGAEATNLPRVAHTYIIGHYNPLVRITI